MRDGCRRRLLSGLLARPTSEQLSVHRSIALQAEMRTDRKHQLKILTNESGSLIPNHELPAPSNLSTNATSPRIAMSSAVIPAASFSPSIAPWIIALIRFFDRLDSSSGGTAASVSGVSVSGISNFATTTQAGIDRIEAEIRCPAIWGNTPLEMPHRLRAYSMPPSPCR